MAGYAGAAGVAFMNMLNADSEKFDKTMSKATHSFRSRMLADLLPFLEDKGFKRWTPSQRDDAPFVHLRRFRGTKRDLVDLQFGTYGRMACFVNLASIDGEAVQTMYSGEVAADQITTADLTMSCRIRGNSLSGAFKPTLWVRFYDPEVCGARIAEAIIKHWSSAESWFNTQRGDKYLRIYKLM